MAARTEKPCSLCKVVKPASEFYSNESGRRPGTLASRCKECTKTRMRAFHAGRDKVAYAKEMREYRAKNKEWLAPKMLEWNRGYRARRKAAVFSAYGDVCVCCGEREPKFLSVDHIFGGGKKHVKSLGGVHFYDWLVRSGFPSGFQLLCHNCNQAKGHYGACPHMVARYELPFAVRMEA